MRGGIQLNGFFKRHFHIFYLHNRANLAAVGNVCQHVNMLKNASVKRSGVVKLIGSLLVLSENKSISFANKALEFLKLVSGDSTISRRYSDSCVDTVRKRINLNQIVTKRKVVIRENTREIRVKRSSESYVISNVCPKNDNNIASSNVLNFVSSRKRSSSTVISVPRNIKFIRFNPHRINNAINRNGRRSSIIISYNTRNRNAVNLSACVSRAKRRLANVLNVSIVTLFQVRKFSVYRRSKRFPRATNHANLIGVVGSSENFELINSMVKAIIGRSKVSKKRTIRKRVSVKSILNARRKLFNVDSDRQRHVKLLKRRLVKADLFQLFTNLVKQRRPHNRRLRVICVSRNTLITQKVGKSIHVLRAHTIDNRCGTGKRINLYFARSPFINCIFQSRNNLFYCKFHFNPPRSYNL
uniref:Uncharacterized protein n=2 Tax=unclassified Caudoviricetes TaxID=2788787 RepID=A0A8S5U2N0_9CAUD|nr:MAG TPA: hypothetical protein [Podoviridae sp. cte242]DAF88715.1 MAG TPA: hypothetical protein [Podoviridae sp. ctCDM29]